MLIDWPPAEQASAEQPPPAEGIRAAVTGAVAAVLRESGYRVATAGPDGLLVTAARPLRVAAPDALGEGGREPAGVPEQWWG